MATNEAKQLGQDSPISPSPDSHSPGLDLINSASDNGSLIITDDGEQILSGHDDDESHDLDEIADFDASFSSSLQNIVEESQKSSTFWASTKPYLHVIIDGDLAGFQLFWILISVVFVVLKIGEFHPMMARIKWATIFLVPFVNTVLTGWFDLIITKYQSSRAVESLKKSRFIVLCLIKVAFSVYVITYYIWGPYSFLERFEKQTSFQNSATACQCQIICVYISLIGAVVLSEIMISTVLINSEQNLSQSRTPTVYRVILLFMRPFVWVYNRTMVMFLCFYAIYGAMHTVYVVGVICDYFCQNKQCELTQSVGMEILLVPFTVPAYLLQADSMFSSWKDVADDKLMQEFVITFLLQSFYVDILNSCWQFSRPLLIKLCKGKENYLSHDKSMKPDFATSPKNDSFLRTLSKELPDPKTIELTKSNDGGSPRKQLTKSNRDQQ